MIVINFKDAGISGNGLRAVLMVPLPVWCKMELPRP